MKTLNEWPAALKQKWILSCTVGVGCLTIGVIVSIALQDRTLLILSILLALGYTARCIHMYRQISAEAYEVVEGVCIRVRKIPLRKQQEICLLSENGTEETVLLVKQPAIHAGNYYRLYFHADDKQSKQPFLRTQRPLFALENLGDGHVQGNVCSRNSSDNL